MTFRNILVLYFFEKELFNSAYVITLRMSLLLLFVFTTLQASLLFFYVRTMLEVLLPIIFDTWVFVERDNLTIKQYIL